MREDVVDPMRGGFRHASGVTGGTDTATLARIRGEEVVIALEVAVVALPKESALATRQPLLHEGKGCVGYRLLAGV